MRSYRTIEAWGNDGQNEWGLLWDYIGLISYVNEYQRVRPGKSGVPYAHAKQVGLHPQDVQAIHIYIYITSRGSKWS